MCHQADVKRIQSELISEAGLRRLIRSRVETIGLLACQTDVVSVMAEKLIELTHRNSACDK